MDDTLTRPLGVNETITFSFYLVGRESHSFVIKDLASNCTLASDDPLEVGMAPRVTRYGHFHIACTGTVDLRDQIVFGSDRHGHQDIYVVDTDGSNPIQLTDLDFIGYRYATDPMVSPDGRKIVFSAIPITSCTGYVCLPNIAHRVINADGSGGFSLPFMRHVSWAPNATKIAYSDDYIGRNADIYVVNADGSGRINLTNGMRHNASNPMWSPDGSKIVFSSAPSWDAELEADVWVINGDGTGPMKLTTFPAGGWAPAWSPDGSTIAFVSNRDGNDEIYVMNADGTDQTNLTNHPAADGGAGPNHRPAWSPDGSKILFMSRRVQPTGEMYVMNADGTSPLPVPHSWSARYFSWSWSPDGSKFVFEGAAWGSPQEIWTMNTDGTALTNITDDPANDCCPTWSP